MDNSWPPIIPLGQYEKPPFPMEALPKRIQVFARELSESCQVPGDLPACLILSVGAAVIANRLEVRAGREWSEPGNLYVAVVLPPANRKSAIFRAVTTPLDDIEKDEAIRLKPQIDTAKQERRIWEASLKKAEKLAIEAMANGDKDENTELHKLREQEPKIPKIQRLLADDVTPEKLASLMSDNNHERIALMSAEGGVFDIMAGRYSRGQPNLDVYLKGHAGDTLRVDRQNRGPDSIKHPALTIGITIQPEVLTGLIDKPGFVGRGLLPRFLISIPHSLVGYRQVDMPGVNPRIRYDYVNTIKGLYSSTSKLETCRVIDLSNDAQAEFRKYQIEIEANLAPGKNLEAILEWGGKLAGAVARIALILHSLEHPDNPWNKDIEIQTILNAIAIGNYFKAHAFAALDLMGSDPTMLKARKTIDWLKRERHNQFSQRDLHQALRGQFKRVNECEPVLSLLADLGYVTQIMQSVEGPGRKPSPIFAVNPELHTQITQFTQNQSAVSTSNAF